MTNAVNMCQLFARFVEELKMNRITDKERENALKILDEVKKEDDEALEKLRQKCKWEHVSLLGVILQWGDPRGW